MIETIGSHTEDEWQALVRKYGWRCFYCGSPMSAWRDASGKVYQIRNRNAAKPWETSGKVLAYVEATNVAPENILTKDHLVPLFHNNIRVDEIWNIRPADLRCNRLKGSKTVSEFLNERQGLIFRWIESLPPDDWRVEEWSHYHTDKEIEDAIQIRFPLPVRGEAQRSTGVFALASDSVFDSRVGVEKRGEVFAVASTPSPLASSLEEKVNEPELLKKVSAERERVSWFWRNRA
jgi:hypothetical protein